MIERMKRKIYEPVRKFERATSYCPLYLAWRIVDEARDYFRTEIHESYARKLARRAEAVFAHHPSWAREATPRGPAGARQKFQCQRQREFILKFMRHWLAGVLARERPALFRALPESFKIGVELPEKPRSSGRQSAQSNQSRFTSAATVSRNGRRNLRPRFVHGCELLPA
jgi:hypothetical protein